MGGCPLLAVGQGYPGKVDFPHHIKNDYSSIPFKTSVRGKQLTLDLRIAIFESKLKDTDENFIMFMKMSLDRAQNCKA